MQKIIDEIWKEWPSPDLANALIKVLEGLPYYDRRYNPHSMSEIPEKEDYPHQYITMSDIQHTIEMIRNKIDS